MDGLGRNVGMAGTWGLDEGLGMEGRVAVFFFESYVGDGDLEK